VGKTGRLLSGGAIENAVFAHDVESGMGDARNPSRNGVMNSTAGMIAVN